MFPATSGRGRVRETRGRGASFLEAYQEHLYELRKRDGSRLSASSQVARLVPIRAFFSWACKKDHLLANPSADLDMPKLGRHLPSELGYSKIPSDRSFSS